MANKLYEQQMNFQNQNGNPMQQFDQMKQNPLEFLASRGINIPQQYANDPRGAVQYLITNGQMNQGMFGNLMSRVKAMGFRF